MKLPELTLGVLASGTKRKTKRFWKRLAGLQTGGAAERGDNSGFPLIGPTGHLPKAEELLTTLLPRYAVLPPQGREMIRQYALSIPPGGK